MRSHGDRGRRERGRGRGRGDDGEIMCESEKLGTKSVKVFKDSNSTSSAGKRVRFERGKDSEDESDVNGGGEDGESGEGSDSEGENFEESDGYIDDSGASEEDVDTAMVDERGGEGEGEGEEGRSETRYLPPHVRNSGQRTAGLEKLHKAVQGLVNRYNP